MTTRKNATSVVATFGTERRRNFGVMTSEERTRDIQTFGTEIRKSKASARSFLIAAGILDKTGTKLVKQLRA